MNDSLKERLQKGIFCKGTFLLFSSGGDFALFLAGLGFDYFIFDLEHSMFDLAKTRETILAARSVGLSPIVRIPELAYHFVSRVLDAGAEGIMLPRVERREDAETLVRFARYRPDGERGISTFAGQTSFSKIPDVPNYLKQRNQEVMLIVQIETIAGVDNREAILSTPGIDACFIGTGDLAMGMGHAGDPDHPRVLEAAEKVLSVAENKQLVVSIVSGKPGAV